MRGRHVILVERALFWPPSFPVVGSALGVCNGGYPNRIHQFRKKDNVWKSSDVLFSESGLFVRRTSIWILRQFTNRVMDFGFQVQSQALHLLLIPLHGCIQFRAGRRMDDDQLHEYFLRSSADTLSQGSPLALPSRISFALRSNSSSQSFSACGSAAPSRDKIKKCASSARSTLGSPANCDFSLSAAVDIGLNYNGDAWSSSSVRKGGR